MNAPWLLVRVALLTVLLVLIGAEPALSHGGGLDANGGHHCREAGYNSGKCSPLGSYHCHRAGCVAPGQAPPVEPVPVAPVQPDPTPPPTLVPTPEPTLGPMATEPPPATAEPVDPDDEPASVANTLGGLLVLGGIGAAFYVGVRRRRQGQALATPPEAGRPPVSGRSTEPTMPPLITRPPTASASASSTMPQSTAPGPTPPHVPTCASCAATLRQDSKFCPSCGAPRETPQAIACPACGAETIPGARFCDQCAAPLI